MTKDEVLTQLNRKEISSKQAYRMLYKPVKERKPRRVAIHLTDPTFLDQVDHS